MGHDADHARDERTERVIDIIKMQGLETRRVGRHAKAVNLARTLCRGAVSGKEALQYDNREARYLAGRENVFVPPNGPNLARDPADCVGIVGAYGCDAGQLSE